MLLIAEKNNNKSTRKFILYNHTNTKGLQKKSRWRNEVVKNQQYVAFITQRLEIGTSVQFNYQRHIWPHENKGVFNQILLKKVWKVCYSPKTLPKVISNFYKMRKGYMTNYYTNTLNWVQVVGGLFFDDRLGSPSGKRSFRSGWSHLYMACDRSRNSRSLFLSMKPSTS